MIKYVLKRLVLGVLVLLGISVLIFALARVIPGDPARTALGQNASKEAVEDLRAKMHLNDPILTQYYYWINDVLHGNFGLSVNSKRPVLVDLQEFLPATMELILTSALFSVILTFLLGILAAKYKNSFLDGFIRISSYIGISVPPFVWGVIFLLLFSSVWHFIPLYGRISSSFSPPPSVTGFFVIDFLLVGNFAGAWNAFLHLLLPAFSLCIGCFCQESRILRSSLIDNDRKEFISVTNSYGIPKNVIMSKYLLKVSSVSVITVIGLDFAATLGNAFLVEEIFNYPGMAKYAYKALLTTDLNAISASVLIIGILYFIVNILVDLINAALDPRVRLGA